MRLLSEDDLRWVTGGCESHQGSSGEHCIDEQCLCYGTTVDDVVVTGHRHDDFCGHESPFPDASDEPENPWPPEDDYDDPPPASSGPPPAPPPPQDDKPPEWNECLDRKADTLAKNIHDEIAAKGDQLKEWGALIWKDASGNLHRTELVPGTATKVPLFDRTPESYGFENWGQVVGVVHSHPTHTQVVNTNGTEDTSDDTFYQHSDGTNNIPISSESQAWLPSGGDHVTMDDIASRAGADVPNLRQYISHGSDVKEFDYYNNDNKDLIGQDRHTASKASTSFQPGASCPS